MIATRPSPSTASATMPITTGVIPYSNPRPTSVVPYSTYAHASTSTMHIAGRMKHAPPTSRPAQPARRRAR